MAESQTQVEFENDRVRVLRVRVHSDQNHEPPPRGDRVLIWLRDAHVKRIESGETEVLHRSAGDVAWRARSQHQIENLGEEPHEIIIVELKD